MVAAIRQIVTVKPDGAIEIRSPELRPGEQAEVIVLIESHTPRSNAERVALWDKLQRSMNLTPEAAAEWQRQVREEREAFGPRT